jgi:hypothetical protein
MNRSPDHGHERFIADAVLQGEVKTNVLHPVFDRLLKQPCVCLAGGCILDEERGRCDSKNGSYPEPMRDVRGASSYFVASSPSSARCFMHVKKFYT